MKKSVSINSDEKDESRLLDMVERERIKYGGKKYGE